MEASPTRPESRRTTVPPTLVALLLAVLALGLAWNLVTPANQAPDEFAHMGYTQYLAETGSLPGRNLTAPTTSDEQEQALIASNGIHAAALLGVHVEWDRPSFEQWRKTTKALPDSARKNGSGPNPASSNPPLYYLTAVPAYLLGSGGDFFTRLTLVRLVSLLWLLGAVVGAWLLAGEIFGRRRALQLGVAGFVGFAPMNQFIGNSVNPDAAVFATWALAMWLAVRLLNRGLTAKGVLALFVTVGAACVVKATSFALVPAAAVVLLVALVRARRAGAPLASGRIAGSIGLAAGGLAATFGVWTVISRLSGAAASAQAADVTKGGLNPAELLSYVWQFYLPKLPFQEPIAGQAPLPVYEFFVKGTWGAYGWLEVKFPGWLYVLLAILTVAVAVLALLGLWRGRRTLDWGIVAFFVLLAGALLAGLHLTEYQKGGIGFIQGRYLLPLAPLAGLALVRAIRWAPPLRQSTLIAASLAGLLVLNLFSLGLVVDRFYA